MFTFKVSFLFLSTLFVFSARADVLDRDGILRNDDGTIRRMSQVKALRACPEGTHLPTIREMAAAGHGLGARGLLEPEEAKAANYPEGYAKIDSINANDNEDEFYFNYNGYKTPAGDLGKNWFWTSSRVVSGHQDYDESKKAYYVNGKYGYALDDSIGESKYYFVAVRCFVNE